MSLKNILAMFVLTFMASYGVAANDEKLAQFLKSDETSRQAIGFAVVSDFYKETVVDLGLSTREKSVAATTMGGAPFNTKRNRWTFFEGARVPFIKLKEKKAQQLLKSLRSNLQYFPESIPLQTLSKNQQIAYWLNLYNIALIEKVASENGWRMESKLYKRRGVLSEKFISVMGVNLSLNDIQFEIVYKLNEQANPLLMYGFFQGVIGSPKIRSEAYTGQDLYKQLAENAYEFINSNRGTFWQNKMKVSWYYKHNQMLFPDFQNDLTNHVRDYLTEPMKSKLSQAKMLSPTLTSFYRADFNGGERMRGKGYNIVEHKHIGARADLEREMNKRAKEKEKKDNK